MLTSFALLIVLTPVTATADLVWEQLFEDDFENSMDRRWDLTVYGRGDVLELATEYDGTGKATNTFLKGEALDAGPNHGYLAEIPTLKELGLHELAPTYVIKFSYRVSAGDFCWTMPLVSPDMSLVITECSSTGGALLGLIDERLGNLEPCAQLTLGDWHDFRIVVERDLFTGVRTARLFVDEKFVGTTVRTGESPFDRICFMDLPVAPVDMDSEVPPPTPSFFGRGDWDNVSIAALRPVTPSGGRFDGDIRVYPNPANPATTISLTLERPTRLDIDVYDLRGRLVNDLYQGVHPAGPVSLRWRGTDSSGREVASGAYLVQVTTPEGSRVIRATLAR